MVNKLVVATLLSALAASPVSGKPAARAGHRAGPRGVRRCAWLAEADPDPAARRLHRHRGRESDAIAGRRRRNDQARHRCADATGRARRPLLRRRCDHRGGGGQSEGQGAGLSGRVRARRRRAGRRVRREISQRFGQVVRSGFGRVSWSSTGRTSAACSPPTCRSAMRPSAAATQKPVSSTVFGASVPKAAWKSIPSWYVVSRQDHAIQPNLERFYAKRMGAHTSEVNASHVAFISHPQEIARVIEAAATAAAK